MDKGVIEADSRHTIRRMRTSMHGNAIRALVELITNSDDSYTRLEECNELEKGRIEIGYNKESYKGIFSVRDFAEGMSIADVQNGFKKYGASTSGMKEGKKVRGYFGQGAKDALINMSDGKICTFKNNDFVECNLFVEDNKPMYAINDPIPITDKLRKKHKISYNGTVVYFTIDPQKNMRVPQFNTVHEELANNYLLRKILSNPKRKIILIDEDTSKSRQLRYILPDSKEIYSEEFSIDFKPIGEFKVFISIWRSEKELSQTGDSREGGFLITDENESVLGISLFKYDNEPLANRLLGEIKIDNFRKLLENEEPVLDEERNGLVLKHPFCKKLIEEIEKRIETQIDEEKRRRQKEIQSRLDREEINRYKKAFNILNEIAQLEAQPIVNLGHKYSTNLEEPPNGIAFYPPSAQITLGKRYAFELRINSKLIRHGSVIKIICSTPKIKLLTQDIQITKDEAEKIIQKFITVEGVESNIEGILKAIVGNRSAEAKIYIVPEKELLFSEGMIFQPETVTLRPNQSRKVYLLVYTKIIESGSIVKLKVDNESIHISQSEFTINEATAKRHVAKYEFEIWGEGVGQEAIITAEYLTYIALLEVKIKSKDDDKNHSSIGMFSEPDFNYEPEPIQRCSYSLETGKIIIYVNFPSIQHYLGIDCKFRKTVPAQILIADIVAEKCFYEIARKKAETITAINPEAISDRIQSLSYELSKKYGKKVHQALVDQTLLAEFQKVS